MAMSCLKMQLIIFWRQRPKFNLHKPDARKDYQYRRRKRAKETRNFVMSTLEDYRQPISERFIYAAFDSESRWP